MAPTVYPDETFETLGPLGFIQKKKGHRLTVDAVLLADFLLPLGESDHVIDIGTGSGAIPLILAWKTGISRIEGIEVDDEAASIAQRNVDANNLSSRITIVKKDFRDLPAMFAEGAFSVVVSNPPYVKAGSGRISPLRERAAARAEVTGNLKDLIEVSGYLAGESGKIFYVFPVHRLFELIGELGNIGLRARRIKFIHTRPGKPARFFLIEAGRKGELKIEESVFL